MMTKTTAKNVNLSKKQINHEYTHQMFFDQYV